MKNHYFLEMLVAISFLGMAVPAAGQHLSDEYLLTNPNIPANPDSIIQVSELFGDTTKYIYEYDEDGKLITEIRCFPNGEDIRHVNSYNEYGDPVGYFTYKRENGSEWKLNEKSTTVYEYDNQGRIIYSKKKQDIYKLESEHFFTYEDSIVKDSYTYTDYVVPYVFKGRGESTYDKSGNLLSLHYYNRDTERPTAFYEYTYNEDNKMTSYTSKDFDSVTGEEQIRPRIVYTYEDDYRTVKADRQVLRDGEWIFHRRVTYLFTPGNPVKVEFYASSFFDDPWYEYLDNTYYYHYPKGATSNEILSSEVSSQISVKDGRIHIMAQDVVPVYVYSLDGNCRYQGTVVGSTIIPYLPMGFYIVQVGMKTIKVRID